MNGLSPGNANRVTGLLGAIFSYAVKKKLRPDNPAHGITKAPDVKRLRRLSDAEYQRLHVAIRDTQSSVVGDIFRMLAVSGWRNSEARCLKWSEVDLERRVAILGDTKSGQSVRPLSGAACEIIKRQERSSPYVFEYQQGKPIGHLSLQWRRLRMPKDVTPHTLRHSFASLAADMGLADHTIAGLLGHVRHSITSRYMHLADKALIEAADLVANETLRLMHATC
jgi:integrase